MNHWRLSLLLAKIDAHCLPFQLSIHSLASFARSLASAAASSASCTTAIVCYPCLAHTCTSRALHVLFSGAKVSQIGSGRVLAVHYGCEGGYTFCLSVLGLTVSPKLVNFSCKHSTRQLCQRHRGSLDFTKSQQQIHVMPDTFTHRSVSRAGVDACLQVLEQFVVCEAG